MSSEGFSVNSLRRLISSLNSIRFKDEVGEVEYFGQKVVVLRRDAFTLMRKELLRVSGGSANVILGIAGRRVGIEEGRELLARAKALGLKSQQSLPELVRIAVEETNMGYGKIKINELSIESGVVTLDLANGFEAEQFGQSLRPCCVYTLSYLEGVFSQLLGRTLWGTEVSCRGTGDEVCKFRFSAGPESQQGKTAPTGRARQPDL